MWARSYVHVLACWADSFRAVTEPQDATRPVLPFGAPAQYYPEPYSPNTKNEDQMRLNQGFSRASLGLGLGRGYMAGGGIGPYEHYRSILQSYSLETI